MNILLAQVFGLLGTLSMILSSWQKTKFKILLFLIFDCLFYIVQYILLGALSGTFTNVIGLVRTIIFSLKDRYIFLQNKIILFIIILLYLIVGILTYNGLISVFPVIVSILYSIIIWQNSIKKIRVGTSLMILSWIIYNLSVGAYIGALAEIIIFISSIMAIIKYDILKIKYKKDIKKLTKIEKGNIIKTC